MSTFSRADIDEYEWVDSLPGGMRGMLGYYRAVIDDMQQNKRLLTHMPRRRRGAIRHDGLTFTNKSMYCGDVGVPTDGSDKKVAKPAVPRRMGRPAGINSTRSILIAAKQLFLEAGFEGVNLERVGKAAGVTRQTVYNLFGSKEAVFRAMVELHWETIARDSSAALSASLDVTLGPAVVLRRFGEAIVRFIDETEQVAFTRLVISESHQRPWIAEDFYRLGKQPLLNGFVVCLRRLHKAGLIACPQPLVAAHQFFGMIQEMVIWPQVMAIGAATKELPTARLVIDEAVLTFLSRYAKAKSTEAARESRPRAPRVRKTARAPRRT